MKIYDVEKQKLELFIERYENFIKNGEYGKKELSVEDKDCVSMMIIDLCCICDQNRQNPKNLSYWNNSLIDEFVKNNQDFYQRCKVIRDSFIAHLDHSNEKMLKINNAIENMGLEDSISFKNFYILCKNIVLTAEII